jgi:hypothetical protein
MTPAIDQAGQIIYGDNLGMATALYCQNYTDKMIL